MEQILKCVHPLLVEDDSVEGYPYFNIGSGFLIFFGGHIYLVTAKHTFANHDVEPDQIRIRRPDRDDEFVPIDRIHRLNAEGEEGQDYADLALLRVKPRMLTQEAVESLFAFPIDNASIWTPGDKRIKFVRVRGYPRVLNDFNYEEKKIPRKSFTFDATPSGRAYREQHCYTLDPCKPFPQEASHPDQLSGSPAFAILEVRPGQNLVKLAGVVIKCEPTGKYARFIGAEVLYSALVDARERDRQFDEQAIPHPEDGLA
jgi:hypothetical protein